MQVVNCSFECFSPRHSKKQRNPVSDFGRLAHASMREKKGTRNFTLTTFRKPTAHRLGGEVANHSHHQRLGCVHHRAAGDVDEGCLVGLAFFLAFSDQLFPFSLIYVQENLVGKNKHID